MGKFRMPPGALLRPEAGRPGHPNSIESTRVNTPVIRAIYKYINLRLYTEMPFASDSRFPWGKPQTVRDQNAEDHRQRQSGFRALPR